MTKIIFAFLVLLSVASVEGRHLCHCSKIYRPVCCKTLGGQIITSSSACQCECSHGTVLYNGSCKHCLCPITKRPVCCKTSKGLVTMPSACDCKCAKGVVYRHGECPVICPCPKILRPVCCNARGRVYTAGNSCQCRCSRGFVISTGPCPTPTATPTLTPTTKPIDCICPKIYNPVCCKTRAGFVTKSNSCLCRCVHGSIVSQLFCSKLDCFCPQVYDPVCCRLPTGLIVKTGNSCECGCKKGTVVREGCGHHE